MSITRLPSGRYRAQVYHAGRNVSVGTFDSKREAKAAREHARARLTSSPDGVTVGEFWERWTTDPLFARPKVSTNRHNAERTQRFAQEHRDMRLADVNDGTVARWLAGGKNRTTVPALRAMFNDAASAKAGRLLEHNPWSNLGLAKSTGNRDRQPPSEEQVWSLIHHARELCGPSFAAWLQVAAFTGMRPGELDSLRWVRVDLAGSRIDVAEQFNANSRSFTTPKNGLRRPAILTPPARDALLSLPRESEFCFVNLHGSHFTASARAYHWKAVKAAAGWTGSLYLATRHFAGWYMVNVLGLDSEDVAFALGHEDGGQLVRRLYGHRDRQRALERVQTAFESAGNVRPLRVVREDSG